VKSFQLNGALVSRGVVNRLERVMMMTWGSPFLSLTYRKLLASAPPDLLTTTRGYGKRLSLLTSRATKCASTSAPPFGPAGMMNSIGFYGSHVAPSLLHGIHITITPSIDARHL
jgi:hypothetical protein